jgi:hypothetical protein
MTPLPARLAGLALSVGIATAGLAALASALCFVLGVVAWASSKVRDRIGVGR